MNKIIITLSLLLSISTAFSGDTKGNGGDILSCNDSQILFHNISLDYYELIYIHQLQIPNYKSLNEIQIVEDKLELIKEKDLHRYLRMKSLLGTFYRDTKWINSPLADINDAGEVSLPIGCELLQIINQNKQLLSGTKKYIIRKDLWDSLDTINKSMLIMHELIYLDSKSITSENIRFYNILLFSEKIINNNSTSYFNLQNLLNFNSVTYLGVEVDITKKIQSYESDQLLIKKAAPIEGSIFYFKNKEYKLSYHDIHFYKNGIPKEFCLFDHYTIYKNNQKINGHCNDSWGEYSPIKLFNNGDIQTFSVLNNTFETDTFKIYLSMLDMNFHIAARVEFYPHTSFKKITNSTLELKKYNPIVKIGGKKPIFFSKDEKTINSYLSKPQLVNIGPNSIRLIGPVTVTNGNILKAFNQFETQIKTTSGKYLLEAKSEITFDEKGEIISFNKGKI